MKITHIVRYILNITKEDKNFFENDKELGITYLKVDVEDSATENINVWFEECFKFLDKAISEKKRVLVHCHHGISRSATVVIAVSTLLYLKLTHRSI